MRNTRSIRKISEKCTAIVMTILMAVSPAAAALAFPVTVYAKTYETTEDVPANESGEKCIEQGDILTHNTSTLTKNAGTVVNNEEPAEILMNETTGTVTSNHMGALVLKNKGRVIENNGDIGKIEGNSLIPDTGNYGTVITNKALVAYNDVYGSIETNTGDGSQILRNYGTIKTNEAVNKYNYGQVNTNSGEIKNNYGRVEKNAEEGTVQYNKEGSVVKTNNGYIGVNLAGAQVTTNNGTTDANNSDAQIITNNSTINLNSGTVISNSAGGTIKRNNNKVGELDEGGNITGNYGVIEVNVGEVLNLDGGVVKENNGIVYNFGSGSVESYLSASIVYYSISISDFHSTSSSTGLTEAYGKKWLAQEYTDISTATVTITPDSGYKITNVSGFGDNVTAVQNNDGTWTLTISSGANTEINVSSELINPSGEPHKVTVNNGMIVGGGDHMH